MTILESLLVPAVAVVDGFEVVIADDTDTNADAGG